MCSVVALLLNRLLVKTLFVTKNNSYVIIPVIIPNAEIIANVNIRETIAHYKKLQMTIIKLLYGL